MILPKGPLVAGRFRGLRQNNRFIMDIYQWKMTINESNFIGKLVYQTSRRFFKRLTARSLKVSVLDDGQERVFRPDDLVIGPFDQGLFNRCRREAIGGWIVVF